MSLVHLTVTVNEPVVENISDIDGDNDYDYYESDKEFGSASELDNEIENKNESDDDSSDVDVVEDAAERPQLDVRGAIDMNQIQRCPTEVGIFSLLFTRRSRNASNYFGRRCKFHLCAG